MHAIDASRARELVLAAIGVFAAGFAVLLILSPSPTSGANVNGDAAAVLSAGTAFASYAVQSAPFRAWRRANGTAHTSSWLQAIVTALIYTVATTAAAVPFVLLAMLLSAVIGTGRGSV